MEEIILYSTGCPKCEILVKKLNAKNIKYSTCNDINTMLEIGIDVVPELKIGNKLMSFSEAIKWVNGVNN